MCVCVCVCVYVCVCVCMYLSCVCANQVSHGLSDDFAGVPTTNKHGSLGVLMKLWCSLLKRTLGPLVLGFSRTAVGIIK